MTYIQTIVLSVIQGLTEFLPISSSAHLILPTHILGWEEQGIAFDTTLHLGSLLAILIYFRTTLKDMLANFWNFILKKQPINENGKLLIYVIIGTIPVGIVGVLSKSFIENNLRSLWIIAFTTIFFGLLLYIAELVNKKKNHTPIVTLKEATLIGLAQCLSLIPGTSRSGITLTAGYFLKLSPQNAANFSFLLSIPVIILSGGYSLLKLILKGDEKIVSFDFYIIGAIISFVVSYLVIDFFLKMLKKIGLLPFVIYRVILGIVLFTLLYVGIIPNYL
ncbi:MAG: undecaprenyl-diphosphate phosphatase [Succinivibrionaceae bacterium]